MSVTEPKSKSFSVLLVDDDSADVLITSGFLQEQSGTMTIDHVQDGEEALSYLRGEEPFHQKEQPDLMLLDLNMPRMDGRELLSIIKTDEELRSIPIVVLSTSDSKEDIDHCYRLHANSYINKSADLKEFKRTLNACTEFWLATARLPAGQSSWHLSAESTLDDSFPIIACTTCDAQIPPLSVGAGIGELRWECQSCGGQLVGRLHKPDRKEFRENLRPIHYFGDERPTQAPDQRIRNFVRELVAKDDENDRRGAARRALALPILAIKLDEDMYPLGESFTVLSRDISASGISMIHTEKLAGGLAILIEIPGQGPVQFVTQIVRNNPTGPFFEIGGKFVNRI